jgi:hypothetical protein
MRQIDTDLIRETVKNLFLEASFNLGKMFCPRFKKA